MSALEDLEERIKSELHLIRRELGSRLAPIRAALERYERAVEERAVTEYCQQHRLKQVKGADVPPDKAAQLLYESVLRLPELGKLPSDEEREPSQTAAEPPLPREEDPVARAFREKFPALSRATETGRLLVFGAFSGRTKSLPGPLGEAADFVDTARDGNQKVTSATRRVKNGGIFGVVICDQAISHQHAEPAVAAARAAGVPVAYAGKGGNASLARAIEALEEQLAEHG